MVRNQTEVATFNIIRTRYVWYSISALLFVASIIGYFAFGFKLGIDFTGGSLLKVHYTTTAPSVDTITEQLQPLELGDITVQPSNDNVVILRTPFLTDDQRQQVITNLGADVEEQSFESVGPTVGDELRTRAIQAIALVVLAIVIYVTWAFKGVSKGPVPSWAYGLSTVIALLHDVVITVGVFIFLGHFYDIELNVMFITALLTILGFSVHDTIVVFDRIREGIKRSSEKTFAGVINESINHTLMRSLNTSTTALIVLGALVLFGGESTRYFVFALFIGIIIGTYSSIFIASPTLLLWEGLLKKRRK